MARTSRHRGTTSPEDHTVEADVDLLVDAGRHVLAHVVGADGQLPVAAVDHHGQLHGPGPAVVAEGVERGPHGPAREQDVVDQDDELARQVTGDVGGGLGQHGADPDVVAVEGHVEEADGHGGALHLLEHAGDAEREGTPPVCSPTRTTSSSPWLRSMISCAMRVSARWTS